jgi:preprotein translocase subunit SecD
MDKSHVASVKRGLDQVGEPALDITFTDQGAEIFADFTRANIGRELAVATDGAILSAPVINEAILGGQVQISGGNNPEEFETMLVLLQLPSLPVTLEEGVFVQVSPPAGCP